MPQPLDYLRETPSQTAGPFVHIGLAPVAAGLERGPAGLGGDPAGPEAPGERIAVEGVIRDGTGTPVRDALIEIWQADAEGRHHARPQGDFRGWGRVAADLATGAWRFETVKPGRVPGRLGHGPMAPHISLWIVARGINVGLSTRIYFDDEAAANAEDPVLRLVEQEARRETLLARRVSQGPPATYRFEIRLQGEGETVFFDV